MTAKVEPSKELAARRFVSDWLWSARDESETSGLSWSDEHRNDSARIALAFAAEAVAREREAMAKERDGVIEVLRTRSEHYAAKVLNLADVQDALVRASEDYIAKVADAQDEIARGVTSGEAHALKQAIAAARREGGVR